MLVAAGVGKSAAAAVFKSAERVDVANQAGGRGGKKKKLQFKEKPENEASGRQDSEHADAQKAISLANFVLFSSFPFCPV